MNYADKAAMVKRFGEQELIELTDRQGLGAIDDEVIDQSLEDATAKINGYLSSRYQLPLPSVPSVVEPMCCDIARYYLYDDVPAEQVTKRYDDAISYLKGVANGSVKLSASDGSGSSEGKSNNLAHIEADGRTFDRDDTKGFI